MAWVACDENGHEAIFSGKPERVAYPDDIPNIWYDYDGPFVNIPSGSIEKLIGRKLTWEDEPVELTATDNNSLKLIYI